jgi:hypothetical protein
VSGTSAPLSSRHAYQCQLLSNDEFNIAERFLEIGSIASLEWVAERDRSLVTGCDMLHSTAKVRKLSVRVCERSQPHHSDQAADKIVFAASREPPAGPGCKLRPARMESHRNGRDGSANELKAHIPMSASQ